MNKKPIIGSILVLILATLVIVYVPKRAEELNSEKTEVTTESITTEQKVSEIATESVTEATTERATIEVSAIPKEVREAKKKLQTEEITEEPTNSVDLNGYGWVQLQYSASYNLYDKHLTRSGGVFYFNGHKETWYSTNEGAGQATAVSIPGKHVADDGTIRDENGYICVASSDLKFYTIVMTSLGPAKVYDCGCSHGTIDVYTNW